MFTHKDIEMRTIFVVNCIEHDRSLRVNSGELMLEEIEGDKKKTLTKFPFQKLLALFIIGHITVTTPLIDKCKKHGVALVVMKPNLRPVFFWANSAEANYFFCILSESKLERKTSKDEERCAECDIGYWLLYPIQLYGKFHSYVRI